MSYLVLITVCCIWHIRLFSSVADRMYFERLHANTSYAVANIFAFKNKFSQSGVMKPCHNDTRA